MSALPSTGQIAFTAINATLGRAARNQLALSDAQNRTLTGVATGQIKFSNFYGKSLVTTIPSSASYDFRSTSSYSGSGSTTVNDLSGNNYTLSFNSAPTYNTSPYSVTLSSGVSAISSAVTINVSGGYSIELLFNYSTNTNNFFKIFSYTVNNDSNGLQIQVNPSNQIYMWNASSNFGLYSASGISANTWFHFVVTSAGTMYINGSAVSTTGSSGSIANTARVLAVGDQIRSRSITGNVALARFYNTALTAAQVSSNYSSIKGSGSYGLP
jgi:hypothetical protein